MQDHNVDGQTRLNHMQVRHYIHLCFLLLFGIAFTSCKNSSKPDKVDDLVNHWLGRKVQFPSSLVFSRFMADTVNFDFSKKPYRVLVYGDSTGCTGCELQLKRWSKLMNEFEELYPDQVEYIFILNPDDKIKLKKILENERFYHPVCVDDDDLTNSLNHFPKDITAHCFLLDSTNSVKLIGNPLYSPKIKDLYQKEIDRHTKMIFRNKGGSKALTTIRLSTDDIWYGQIILGDSIESQILLHNTGSNPFIVEDIVASCDCTTTTLSKKTILAGDSAILNILLVAESLGDLFRTIAIYGNDASSPIVISLNANVATNNIKQ